MLMAVADDAHVLNLMFPSRQNIFHVAASHLMFHLSSRQKSSNSIIIQPLFSISLPPKQCV